MKPPSSEELLSSISLLYVEDDPFTREQLGRLLSRMVGETMAASDGAEGLKVFRERHPDMVLTDLNMPNLDGLSMAAVIKGESPDTPVIAATAHNEEHYLQRAIEVGIDGYVAKPIDLGSLCPVLYKNARLVIQRKQETARRQFISYLLDINPHLILSAAGGKIDYANKTFLQFVGRETLEDLLTGPPGPMDELVLDGKPYRLNDQAWIEQVALKDDERTVASFPALESQPGGGSIFWVTARGFSDLNRVVVTMTDVTAFEKERKRLLYRATTDSLTGVANRYKITEYIEAEHIRFKRYRTPMSLIMFDIDHFKRINDTHGHSVGDQVLSGLAAEVCARIRDTDTLSRWGGEEFMILAPVTPLDEALELAERLRTAVEQAEFPVAGHITCSFGVAQMAPDEEVDALLQRVDGALYKAKNGGRNRVESI